jgi:subtilisin
VDDLFTRAPLAATVAAIFTGVASIVGAILYGVWRLQQSHATHLDTWLTRHERAEFKQFRTIRRLTSAVRSERKHEAEAFDRLAERIESLIVSNATQPPREADYTMRSHVLRDPETGEPIYTLPPDEMRPEALYTAAQLTESRDWGHAPLGIQALHARGVTGDGAVCAVLDTGVDLTHPDLAGRLILSADFTRSPSGDADRQGHGSHCAGIVLAALNDGGIIGVAPAAKLLSGKVLGDGGSGGSGGIASGIRWSADKGADVISLSLGSPVADRQIADAISYAAAKGCWVVAAAGNEGPREGTVGFPGGFPNVVCVAAVDEGLRVAGFSSRGPAVDVAAPGVGILSLAPGGRYARMSGTSMATPYVAGCLTLVRGELKKRGIAPPVLADLLAAIKATARDLDTAGTDTRTGAGLIQPAALIERLLAAATPAPVDPPKPPIDPPAGDPLRVEIASPDLARRGVKLVAFLSPVAAPPAHGEPNDLPAELVPGVSLDEYLSIATKVFKALLPLLHEWAKETSTPIDDIILDVIEKLTAEAKSRAVLLTRTAAGELSWWPLAADVLRLLVPVLKKLAGQTPARADDMMVALIERLLFRAGKAASDAVLVAHRAKVIALSAGLIPATAA